LRGAGQFKRVIENLEFMLEQKRQGNFDGYVSVASVASDDMIPNMYEFCEYFNDKGINTLYINFPWFIPKDVATEMDDHFQKHYAWMGTFRGAANTWHSFDWRVSDDLLDELQRQVERISSRQWDIRIRFQPELGKDELIEFIQGSKAPGQGRTRCLGISNRLDVLPNGKVTPCKKFTELIVGDLNKESCIDVWKGDDYKRFRKEHNNTLHPICSKCEILYMNGV